MDDGRWTVRKVVGYITRERGGKRELLVFTHRDYPEAGIQVPAGTVKDGETAEAAIVREVAEETGLGGLDLVKKVGVFIYDNPNTGQKSEHHVFHLRARASTPDRWEWVETGGGEMADHEGYVFQVYWAYLAGEIELAGNLGDYLGMIRDA